tara:strand:- start:15486 stop:15974 length:489 start_codon:yes stop_codon:yes gene_type:complete
MNDLFNKLYRDLSFGTLTVSSVEDIRNLRRNGNTKSLSGRNTPENSLEWSTYADTQEKLKAPFPYNIIDTGAGIKIQIAAIGLDISEIDIELEGSILRVKHDKEEDDTNFIYKKITNKSFDLTWALSNSLDLDTVDASLDKGMLSIAISLKESATLKKIIIK